MTDLHTAAKLALAALEYYEVEGLATTKVVKSITAIKQALAAPVQEPVAWALSHSRGLEFGSKYPMQASIEAAEQMASQHMGKVTVTPLYTSPPTLSLAQRQARSADTWVHATAWRGLTDEELRKLCEEFWLYPRKLLQAIEAKLKAKNSP